MADPTNPPAAQQPPPAVSLSPAQETGPDLPSREGVPDWVPQGKEERWRNSEKIAGDMFPGDAAAIWQTTRAIFNDETSYPD
jgi:hypothetical protein